MASLIADGMDMIANTKAAIVRLGFIEIVHFTQHFFPRNNQILSMCLISVAVRVSSNRRLSSL